MKLLFEKKVLRLWDERIKNLQCGACSFCKTFDDNCTLCPIEMLIQKINIIRPKMVKKYEINACNELHSFFIGEFISLDDIVEDIDDIKEIFKNSIPDFIDRILDSKDEDIINKLTELTDEFIDGWYEYN